LPTALSPSDPAAPGTATGKVAGNVEGGSATPMRPKPRARQQPILFWALVLTVCLAPLPFGSVYAWSWGLMASTIAVVLAVWVVRLALGREEAPFGLYRTWFLVLPLALVAAWIWLQASGVSPPAWHHPLWTSAAETIGGEAARDPAGAISLNPFQTLSGLARLLTYAAIFWLALQLSHKSARAQQILLALGIAGAAYATYGLLAYAVGASSILWLEAPAQPDSLSATFVSRHSFASYAGLTLLALTGHLQMRLSQRKGAVLSEMTREVFSSGGGDARSRLRRARPSLWSREGVRRFAGRLTWADRLLLLAWLALFGALLASESRFGIGSAVVVLVALVIVYSLSRTVRRGRAAAVAAALVLLLGAVFLAGGERLERELAGLSANPEQPEVYDLTVAAIQDAPFLGTGLGTFEEVFRFYRTSDIAGYHAMANSTYLENILELGLPATLLVFALFAGLLVITIGGIRSRGRDVIFPCLGFTATLLVALHGAVDFSMQIPAVAATYALLMGAACAQCWSSRHPPDPW
jgi:hypothetical protein